MISNCIDTDKNCGTSVANEATLSQVINAHSDKLPSLVESVEVSKDAYQVDIKERRNCEEVVVTSSITDAASDLLTQLCHLLVGVDLTLPSVPASFLQSHFVENDLFQVQFVIYLYIVHKLFLSIFQFIVNIFSNLREAILLLLNLCSEFSLCAQ